MTTAVENDRDKLWALAAINVFDIREVHTLLVEFNRLREDNPFSQSQPGSQPRPGSQEGGSE